MSQFRKIRKLERARVLFGPTEICLCTPKSLPAPRLDRDGGSRTLTFPPADRSGSGSGRALGEIRFFLAKMWETKGLIYTDWVPEEVDVRRVPLAVSVQHLREA